MERLFLQSAIPLVGVSHVQVGVEVSSKTEHSLLGAVLKTLIIT